MKLLGPWLTRNFLSNKFNITALLSVPVSTLLGLLFYSMEKSDTNFTYYLISVTAIYSTIQLTFLLQKISFLRSQKESLMNESVQMWNALGNYRYLIYVMESHLKQIRHLDQKKALTLKVTISELSMLDIGYDENIDTAHLKEFRQSSEDKNWLNFVKLVKMVDSIVNGTGSIFNLNTANRVYAHNNRAVNSYLRFLIDDGIFSLYKDLVVDFPVDSNRKNYIDQIMDKKPYQSLQSLVGSNITESPSTFLNRLDRYIVNDVLLPLHDNTYIIEKKLPNAFLHLLTNALAILLFGTVIPLINSFTVQETGVVRICGGITSGMLLTSMALIILTLFNEHDGDLFTYSKIIYQGKNDQ